MKTMKLILGMFIVAILISTAACTAPPAATPQPTPTERTGSFEIFQVINWYGKDINCSDVEAFQLADKPVIPTEDIISYNWSTHQIELTEDGCTHFQAALGLATPFMIVANDERIYVCWYISQLSSYDPPWSCAGIGFMTYSPWSLFPDENICNNSSVIDIFPRFVSANASNQLDFRNDYRIREALEQAGKLTQ